MYEPCGLNQMYSLRYGTVPIVRRTGGLADSVQHYDPATRPGHGSRLQRLRSAGGALGAHDGARLAGQPTLWRRMVMNGMSQDFSWDKQGAEYERLYERCVKRSPEIGNRGQGSGDIPRDSYEVSGNVP